MAGTPEIARENGKKGGRPKGKKSRKTLQKEKVMEAVRERIMGLAHKLLDKQMILANGQTFLYRIDKEFVKTGKGEKTGYWRNKKPELVTDEWEIRTYIEKRVDVANGDSLDQDEPGESYYFITAKEPNNQAIDSMLDRTFGRATQSTKLVDDKDKSIPITSINVVPIESTNK